MIARSAILTTLAVAGLSAGAAFAQDAAAPAATDAPAAAAQPDMGAAYESARNQLGVLIYCQDKGHIDGKAVETQTKLLTMIPAGDVAKGDGFLCCQGHMHPWDLRHRGMSRHWFKAMADALEPQACPSDPLRA